MSDVIELFNGKPHILVVDDNAMILRNLKSLLEPQYTVTVAPSGVHAFIAIGRQRPDLIILDYEMPGLNGQEVLEQLKTTEETKDIPVVFLTSMDSKDIVVDLLALDPAGYLLKPLEPKILNETLKKILGR